MSNELIITYAYQIFENYNLVQGIVIIKYVESIIKIYSYLVAVNTNNNNNSNRRFTSNKYDILYLIYFDLFTLSTNSPNMIFLERRKTMMIDLYHANILLNNINIL